MSGKRTAEHGSRISARWRIVGWIVLTTALSLLAVMVTLRSVLLTQVATQANHDIIQEVDEFTTFASEGVDPVTAAPFTSATAMLERYLTRQTPATGETLIGVTATDVLFSDNAADDAGETLAGDNARLQAILSHPQSSGVTSTPQGELRWGRTSAQVGGETGTLVVGVFTRTAQERVARETLLLLGVAVGGLLLTAGMAWLASGQILRPIRDIGEVADRIDAIDLSARVPVEGRDDIARLAVTFNQMLDRLETSRKASQHFAAEVQRQLAGPRAQVARLLRVLADDQVPQDERALAAEQARRELESMQTSLADLELLSQADYPDFLTRRPVAAKDLIRHVVADAVALGDDRRWTWESADGIVHVDPGRVVRAMAQLTRNAYQHTTAEQPIHIASEVVGEPAEPTLRLWVATQGPALDQDEARAMLENYRTAGTGEEQSWEHTPGMGLGLAVARAVADAHGGSAWVESSQAGGTRFGLDLPSRPGQASDRAGEPAGQLAAALGQEQ